MSALLLPALAASSSGQGALYVDDVFSTYLRTGTGADTTVTTGIDMTKGYMLWSKGRSGGTEHAVYDSARGVTLDLATNSTAAQTTQTTGLKAVSSTGHTIGSLAKMNTSGATYVDWVFRKAPKFFDAVTYTGNGVAGRQIAHSLGVQAGFVTVKATSATGDWNSYHRSATGDLKLNLTDAQTASRAIITAADASTFTVSGAANTNGVSYVAYLWAHDPSAEGIIQCGSFTTDASGNATVNLGWEPQFLITKDSAVGTESWNMLDTARGWSYADTSRLRANSSLSETTGTVYGVPTATGFTIYGAAYPASRQFIYLAIRRPNKPPTTGTQVYNGTAYAGTESQQTFFVPFVPDLCFSNTRNTTAGHYVTSRFTGDLFTLQTQSTSGEANEYVANITRTNTGEWKTGGFLLSSLSGNTYINHFFRRAPGFFDVVAYTATSSDNRKVQHSLQVTPELIIIKSRNYAPSNWRVLCTAVPSGTLQLNATSALSAADFGGYFGNGAAYVAPTSTEFTVGSFGDVNYSNYAYIAYLFASKAGISKVGSYTGNGSSQTIDCGFSTGARFVLIKRTDATGDWYVWDTARGIVAANDPHLSLNTTAAEVVTDDSIDPASVGFIVNQNAATNINVNGGSYIFLAIA